MLYCKTKSGCKWTSSIKKQSHFDYISPHCDLDVEDSEPIFLQDTSPDDNTPPYQVWLKKIKN